MIDIDEVKKIHSILIGQFGGGEGIRDVRSLESALKTPFQTFDNQELNETPIEKAAALIEGILLNHPFVDGNKRTGYVIMRLFLMSNQMDLQASQDEKYEFVISIAEGKLKKPGIEKWIRNRIIKHEP